MPTPRWPMLLLAGALLGAAAAQAFGGWPHFASVLRAAGIVQSTVAAVGAGWLFGSAVLVAMAGLCAAAAFQPEGRLHASVLAGVIAAVFIVFGAAAWWWRGNPHYAHFVAVGVLAALMAWRMRRAEEQA